jgi:hypothetical protein
LQVKRGDKPFRSISRPAGGVRFSLADSFQEEEQEGLEAKDLSYLLSKARKELLRRASKRLMTPYNHPV